MVVTTEILAELIDRIELFMEIFVEILAEILAEIHEVKASLVVYYLGFSVS